MKVFGHPVSTCTRKVLTTLAETGTPYEMVVIDFATGEHKKEPHLARQPFGKVPAIEDDGFQLYESRAISRYINEKVGGPLIPKDAHGRAVMEQWMSIETENFTPSAMKFIYQYTFGRPQEPAVLEAATKQLATTFGVLDARLATVPYLAGDAFSLADICYLPYIEYLMSSPVKEQMATFPNVSAWWNRCSERPSWRKVTGKV